ncbi:hypothetical protein [Bradyrhizobium sp. Rc2d]|uniref:hypothetical protein n=1 Tax=Bradyrhizobium sp. Rc2d TaxID=1855321 RepID=UPI0015A4DA72|nr:hypothetical protein [Bradyrhizobium sp. Rc2d]
MTTMPNCTGPATTAMVGRLADIAAAGPPMSSKPDPRERGAKGKEMAIRIALAR